MKKRVAIIGAGFSGLNCAYWLTKKGVEVRFFEENPDVGGLIHTHRGSFGLAETAANGILANAELEAMAKDIGVELQETRKESRRRYIFRNGKPRRWPLTLVETLVFIFTKLVFVFRRSPYENESVREWGVRVLGRPMTNWLLGPALQGIYAGDIAKMSATLILGRFYGQKIPLHDKPQTGTLRGTVSTTGGLGEIIIKLTRWLETHNVVIERNHKQSDPETLCTQFDHVVIATSATSAAKLLTSVDSDIAQALAKIEVMPVVTTTAIFPHLTSDSGWIRGFGCLFPPSEGYSVRGVLSNTHIFEGRSVDKTLSETWIFNGQALELSDAAIKSNIVQMRERLTGKRLQPLDLKITRWSHAIPHYTLDLEKDLKLISEPIDRLFYDKKISLVGNYLGSLGLGRLLVFGQQSAWRISQSLQEKK